jgi:hypothetical protein
MFAVEGQLDETQLSAAVQTVGLGIDSDAIERRSRGRFQRVVNRTRSPEASEQEFALIWLRAGC